MTEITNKSRDTKSLLAKLMASEDINVEYRSNISTAAFNTENRTLLMPVFKDIGESTTDLFLGHEVGHALFTPTGVINDVMAKGGTFKSLVNIVEDARIEKMIQSKFPGLRKNFYEGYSELMDRNFFGLNGEDVNELNFIDRINIHFKVGTRAGVEFNDEEQTYVDRIANLRSWDDTIKVSEELEEYCKTHNEEPKEDDDVFDFGDEGDEEEGDEDSSDSPPNIGGGMGDDDTDDDLEDDDGETSDEEPEDSDSDDPSKGAKSDDVNNSNEEPADDDDVAAGAEEEDDAGEEIDSGVTKKSAGVGNDEMISKTMENFESALKDLVDTETEYSYMRIPGVELKKIVVSMDEIHDVIRVSDAKCGFDTGAKEKYLKFRSEQKSLVSYLAKEFEMRKKADEHKRTKVAKTGVLNPNKLHSYKFNEDLLLRSEVVTAGKNHGFLMYIDWSGSMHEQMANTIDQLMILALFCKKINVPFDAYAFSDVYGEGDPSDPDKYLDRYHKWEKNETGDLGINKNFRLLHLVSSTLSSSKFQNSMIQLMRMRQGHELGTGRYLNYSNELPRKLRLGGTPLSEVIISAIKQVPEFQKKHGVQIVNTVFLTDGQGHAVRGVYDSVTEDFQGRGYRHYTKEILVDPVTKIQYGYDGHSRNSSSPFLKALKDRTSARVVGFYIAPCSTKKRFKQEMTYSGVVEWSKTDELWDKMKKESFIVVEDDLGYEQFYIVNSKSLKVKDEEVEMDSEMTKAKMKNTFIKQRRNKVGNKVLLGRFAEFVA